MSSGTFQHTVRTHPAIPLSGPFNEISVFTQRPSAQKQKGTSIGKMGAADRTHLSAETMYLAISRDAPCEDEKWAGEVTAFSQGGRCLCDSCWRQSVLWVQRTNSRKGLIWTPTCHLLHTFLLSVFKENKFFSSFACLLHGVPS